MALYFDMWSLVVQRAALDLRYPGGWRAFADQYLGRDQQGHVDSELVRLGGMAGTFKAIGDLEACGILINRPDRPGDAALGTEDSPIFLETPWLAFSSFDFVSGESDEVTGFRREPEEQRSVRVGALRLAAGSDDGLVMPSWSTSTPAPGTRWIPCDPHPRSGLVAPTFPGE